MAKTNDEAHFEEYREQNQVKHDILAGYLKAYYDILKRTNKNLVYIDGFAGRGTYIKQPTGEKVPGSPLLALQLIAGRDEFSKQVTPIFIEADDNLCAQLRQSIGDFYEENSTIREPVVLHGRFAEQIQYILDQVKGRLAPTFLFVDPCGVSGTSFNAIKSVMDCGSSEAFIFLNISGVNRTAGLEERSAVLDDLFGSAERAQRLVDALRGTKPIEKERIILEHYREALRDGIGAKFTAPFRVEYEHMQATSHYLVHATKNPIGFRIMKDVMWRRGHSEEGGGGLMFVQKSRTFVPLFTPMASQIKSDILDALKGGTMKVDIFFFDWPERPDDLMCQSAYKKALIELEADRKIRVLDKEGITPKLASMRPRPKGRVTLGKGHYVQLLIS